MESVKFEIILKLKPHKKHMKGLTKNQLVGEKKIHERKQVQTHINQFTALATRTMKK